MKSVLLAALLVVVVACHSANASSGRIMPLDFEIPTDLWTQGERAPGGALLGFTVAFSQLNIGVLHDRLMEISDPRHADYGMWLTKEEVDELTNPSASVRSEVVRFLTLNLVPAFIKDQGDHVQVVASVERLESLFRMEFYVWESMAAAVEGKKERAIVSPSDYFLPAELDSVLFLSGLTGFPVPHERRLGVHRPLDLTKRDDQDGKVSPSVINSVYGIDPTSVPANENASLCLAEFQNDKSYSPDDLATFDGQNLLPTTNVAFIIGSLSYDPPDTEATLDVQYGAAIAYNATIWYWSNAGWMYDFTVALSNRAHMPLVVSISWGWTETAQCKIASCNGVSNDQYITATDANWLKIVARGTTVVASSGDNGAPGDGNSDCFNQRTPLTVMYPSVSPYILSVGATMLVEPEVQPAPPADQSPMCASVGGCSQSTTETTCSYPNALITTGGGFSTIESQPSWQASAVAGYVSTYGSQLPPSSLYSAKNRANPDVAGLGHNYVIIVDNKYELVDGTSCSAPVWGGIISLLNQGLMANGKPSLGFVNPLLYQLAVSTPAVFNDITTGDNKCTEKCCSQYGYPATPGWDASTGLGSPNFNQLYQAIVGRFA